MKGRYLSPWKEAYVYTDQYSCCDITRLAQWNFLEQVTYQILQGAKMLENRWHSVSQCSSTYNGNKQCERSQASLLQSENTVKVL